MAAKNQVTASLVGRGTGPNKWSDATRKHARAEAFSRAWKAHMRGLSLSDAMGLIEHKPGTWFWLNDDDTKFHVDRSKPPENQGSHPFVLPDGFDPGGRRAFAHGLPRSSREPRSGVPGVDFLGTSSTDKCDGVQCDLDRTGWIPALRYQVISQWFTKGKYICVERSMTVLGQIQTFDMEAASDA